MTEPRITTQITRTAKELTIGIVPPFAAASTAGAVVLWAGLNPSPYGFRVHPLMALLVFYIVWHFGFHQWEGYLNGDQE